MDHYLLELCETHCLPNEIEGKTIIEIGSYNVNGSFKDILMKMKPLSYLGTDIKTGYYVDELYNVEEMITMECQFDIVVCTEVIEHTKDWRAAITNLMNLTKIGGMILLTSRSKGFGRHNFPADYWRYEIEDIEFIFSEWEIKHLCKDAFINPNNQFQDHFGFFLKAIKINDVIPDFSNYALYNINTDPTHNHRSKIERTVTQ